MEVYTSYYAKVSRIDTSDALIVQVSQTKPDWFNKPVVELPSVYPQWRLINGVKTGELTESEFAYSYGRQLNNLGFIVKEELEALCNEYGVNKCILVCWEAPDKFCHRKQLAEFLDVGATELE